MDAIDWSLGHYEHLAAELLPAAQAALELATLKPGSHLADIGCGTGNAALLAAREPGVTVTGVDPAPRLLQLARERAGDLDVEFVPGDAASIPLADASMDVTLSVFGVIFADDPVAAAAELARITAPDGQIVLTAWLPGSLASKALGVMMQAVAKAVGAPPSMFAWHDEAAVSALFEPHGFKVRLHERELTFTADSLADYWQVHFLEHPMAVAYAPEMERQGVLADAQARAYAILEAGNEDPAAFRATSRYVVITAQR